ncbi:MAG: hypothetical protein IT437_02365 [Phycisphaerales bacterium]|nr:hypothetical protein [Phycisphaerales bacterium]
MSSKKSPLGAITACLVTIAFGHDARAQFSFQKLVFGPAQPTIPLGMSGDGSTVVGGVTNPPGYGDAWRWTAAGGLQAFGLLNHAALGASFDGSVVVGAVPLGGTFLRTASGISYIANLRFPQGISADGGTVFGQTGDGQHAVASLWTGAGGVRHLGLLPGAVSTKANAISGNEVVVGTADYPQPGGHRAFSWSETSGMTALDLLPGYNASRATAVSEDGSVVAGSSITLGASSIACRWVDGVPHSLGMLPGALWSYATSMASDGSVIVGDSGDGQFIWSESSGMVKVKDLLLSLGLDVQGVAFRGRALISADGLTLSGEGGYGSITIGWIATIPSPGAAVIWAIAIATFTPHRRASGRRSVS